MLVSFVVVCFVASRSTLATLAIKFTSQTPCARASFDSLPFIASPERVMSKTDEFADIDAKTNAVFHKKGYKLMGKLGAGAFGQVCGSFSQRSVSLT